MNEELINELNRRIDALEGQLRVKDIVIESLNEKLDNMNDLSNIWEMENNQGNNALKETDKDNQSFNNEYWLGMKSTYEEMISNMIDRLTAKEIEIFGLELENDYLKDQLKEG